MSLLNNVLGSLNPFSWLRSRQRRNDVFESVTELQDEDEDPSTFSDAVEDALVGTESSGADAPQQELGSNGAEIIPQQLNVEGHEVQAHLSDEFTLDGNANGEKPLLCSRMDDPLSLSSGDNEYEPVACISADAGTGTGESEQSKTPEPMDKMLDTNVAVTADAEKSEEMLSKISVDTTPTKVRRKVINTEPRKLQEEAQSFISCGVDKLYGAPEPQEARGVAWRPSVHGAIGETSAMSTMSVKKRKASNDLTADDEEIRFICEGPSAKQVKKIKKVKRASAATSAQNSSSRSDVILCGAGTPLNTPVIVHCPRAKVVATFKEQNS